MGWGSIINVVISPDQNEDSSKLVSDEEIEGVVKAMPVDKALGQDGIPVEFY